MAWQTQPLRPVSPPHGRDMKARPLLSARSRGTAAHIFCSCVARHSSRDASRTAIDCLVLGGLRAVHVVEGEHTRGFGVAAWQQLNLRVVVRNTGLVVGQPFGFRTDATDDLDRLITHGVRPAAPGGSHRDASHTWVYPVSPSMSFLNGPHGLTHCHHCQTALMRNETTTLPKKSGRLRFAVARLFFSVLGQTKIGASFVPRKSGIVTQKRPSWCIDRDHKKRSSVCTRDA